MCATQWWPPFNFFITNNIAEARILHEYTRGKGIRLRYVLLWWGFSWFYALQTVIVISPLLTSLLPFVSYLVKGGREISGMHCKCHSMDTPFVIHFLCTKASQTQVNPTNMEQNIPVFYLWRSEFPAYDKILYICQIVSIWLRTWNRSSWISWVGWHGFLRHQVTNVYTTDLGTRWVLLPVCLVQIWKWSIWETQPISSIKYSISQEICTRFCCALLCCGYAIVHNESTWSIYPYSSGLLCWHWGNR